jgi:murein L,D-transpeptidase YcbB/YkuD
VLHTLHSPKPELAARLPGELKDAVAHRNHDHLLLQGAYGPINYAYRFVKNHLPSKDHEALMARLAEITKEGIDPQPYEIERAKKMAETLTACQQALADLEQQGLNVSQAEKDELRNALLEANLPSQSPAEILAYVATPANRGRFPELYERVTRVSQLAAERNAAESRLELLDAVNFFRLAQEMGVPEDRLIPTWQESTVDMPGTLKKMAPTIRHYEQLVQELARYRKLAQQKQTPLDAAKSAKVGSQGEFVQRIQEHLQLTGYWSGPADGQFDEKLKEAVTAYQANHQLVASGAVGKETITSFNMPFSARVRQIKLGLHRLRMTGTRGVDFFVWVNVAAQQLEVFDQGGATVLRKHKIIVGQRVLKNHTPLFTAQIKMVITFPPWNVPERILREEMLPEYEDDPDYFTDRGYRIKVVGTGDDARVVAVTQPPGEGNALGVVKILFPNPYDVYLHDTPKKFLFAQTVRTFSHGCLRLQNALDLARFLLEHDHNEMAAKVDELVKKHQSQEIHLNKLVPIFVEYSTSSADENGLATFFLDIYGLETEELKRISAD